MRKIVWLFVTFFVMHGASAQLVLKSEKGELDCRFIGRALFDGGVFFSDSTDLGNAVEVNDVRLGMVLHFLEHWSGKIELGFSGGEISLKDVYINYAKGRHQVRVGNFFEPFSLEYRIGSSDMKFNGAAVTGKVFGDKRRLGISYTYHVDPLNVAVGAFGDKDVNNEKEGDEGYALSGRVLYRPYLQAGNVLHVGVSSRFSVEGESEQNTVTFSGGIPSDLIAQKFLTAKIDDAINQWRFGAEVVCVYDKLYVQGEYLMGHVNCVASAENYTGDGCYVQVGYALLTGKYGYDKLTGMAKAPGVKSLEVLCRYNVTNLNDREAGIMGGRQNDFSVGAIYYFNKYVAAKASYTVVDLDKHAREGNQTFSMLQGRLQISF